MLAPRKFAFLAKTTQGTGNHTTAERIAEGLKARCRTCLLLRCGVLLFSRLFVFSAALCAVAILCNYSLPKWPRVC